MYIRSVHTHYTRHIVLVFKIVLTTVAAAQESSYTNGSSFSLKKSHSYITY